MYIVDADDADDVGCGLMLLCRCADYVLYSTHLLWTAVLFCVPLSFLVCSRCQTV